MRTFHAGGVAESDITHGLPRVVELFEARTPKGAARLARHCGVVHVEDVEGGRKVTRRRRRRHTAGRGHPDPCAPGRHRRPGGRGRRRPGRGPEGPEGAARREGAARDPAVPRRGGPEGLPRPGRVDPRQAHRADRPPDAAPLPRGGPGRLVVPARPAGRLPAVRRGQPRADRRRPAARGGAPDAHGDHQGLARDGQLAVGRLLPGDDPGADRGRDRWQEGRPFRA